MELSRDKWGLTLMAATPRQWRLFCRLFCTLCARAKAVEAGFVPALDKDQAYIFTPSELRLY